MAERAKSRCRRRLVGFLPNDFFCFTSFSDIVRKPDEILSKATTAFSRKVATMGRVSPARENEAGGSLGREIHIFSMFTYRTLFVVVII